MRAASEWVATERQRYCWGPDAETPVWHSTLAQHIHSAQCPTINHVLRSAHSFTLLTLYSSKNYLNDSLKNLLKLTATQSTQLLWQWMSNSALRRENRLTVLPPPSPHTHTGMSDRECLHGCDKLSTRAWQQRLWVYKQTGRGCIHLMSRGAQRDMALNSVEHVLLVINNLMLLQSKCH